MCKHNRLNNCLIFAILEAIKNDKYIVIRKSKHTYKWPFCHYHFLVMPKEIVDEYATAYVPIKKSLGNWPSPLFQGRIKKGD